MIAGRFATAREIALAAALALAVFGPSLALAQDQNKATEAEGCRLSGCISGGDGQPTDGGLLDQGPVRTLRK